MSAPQNVAQYQRPKMLHVCRFMDEYDPRLELAPRDIVARAIQDQMLRYDPLHIEPTDKFAAHECHSNYF